VRILVRFGAGEAMPDRGDVLESQGLPDRPELPERIGALLDHALDHYAGLAEPRAVLEEISREDFTQVHSGRGLNADDSPLLEIFPRADGLALFAATLGEPVGEEIHRLFQKADVALGFMLDAVASVGADRLAFLVAERFRQALGDPAAKVLAYSPGYCGWHVSGQGKLFAHLRPEEIGIRLNASFLMQPLKSVSGALVAGRGEIHRFRADFPFCASCVTRECRLRMASVLRD
jgi:hypothetical protein